MIITADFQWKRSTLLRIFIENTQERYIFSSIAANIRVKNYWLLTEIKKPGVGGTASSGPKAEWHFDIRKNVGHPTQSRRKMWFKCSKNGVFCAVCHWTIRSIPFGSVLRFFARTFRHPPLTLRKWYVNIPRQVSQHTLPFIFRYIAIYVNILFLGGEPVGNVAE